MSLSILNSSTSSPLLKAWGTSGLVHGVALSLLAIGGARMLPVELATHSGKIQLEASFSQAEQPEAFEHESSDLRLVVMPQSVQRAEQTFRFESTEPLALADLDLSSTIEIARAEMARSKTERVSTPRVDPLTPPERPRKSTERAHVAADSQPTQLAEEKAAAESVAADFRHNPPPVYPAAAFAARIEGTVLLRLTVARDGRVTRVELLRSSGHPILDGAAVNTVKQWHGQPAKRDGQPVETTETLPVRFQLR